MSNGKFYIVFSPQGEAPAKVVHQTHKDALKVAWSMSRLHRGQEFFVMASASKPILHAELPETGEGEGGA